MKPWPAILCLLMCSTAVAFAQQPPAPKPCSTPEASQFDFWVGEWELSWPATDAQGNPDPKGGRQVGHNSITKVLDGCVIEENFSGQATPLNGLSVSSFNARGKKWQQTWVDNQGGYLDFNGGFSAGKMVLERSATRPDGTSIRQRMVWSNITADSFDWSWESSADGGKTWQVIWPIRYQRGKRLVPTL